MCLLLASQIAIAGWGARETGEIGEIGETSPVLPVTLVTPVLGFGGDGNYCYLCGNKKSDESKG